MSDRLRDFAARHGLTLVTQGEVGFGRPCVGLAIGNNYVDYAPYSDATLDPLPGFTPDALAPPEVVRDAYHKADVLAVLAGGHPPDYDEALRQLALWVEHIEAQGEIEVVPYPTGAKGLQVLISGVFGHAVRLKSAAGAPIV